MMAETGLNENKRALNDASDSLNIIRPDDWHAHFREGSLMHLALPYTQRVFARAIAMPNLRTPLTDASRCRDYHDTLIAASNNSFQPLATLYLSDDTTPEIIAEVKPERDVYDKVFGAKLYPKGATTGAQHGVGNVKALYPVFEEMQTRALPLLLHGESTDTAVDFFDREKTFINDTLTPLRKQFPQLKIVLEHVTTREAVEFVRASLHTAATITPHHLLYNRNALFEDGLRPHRHCLPPAQREQHRIALVQAATGGETCFFAGTDSAPHPIGDKHCDHGCAGIFNAPAALETYTEVFEQAAALDRLEAFVSINGAVFYGVPQNTGRITLSKKNWRVPEVIGTDEISVVPFRAGERITWQVRTR